MDCLLFTPIQFMDRPSLTLLLFAFSFSFFFSYTYTSLYLKNFFHDFEGCNQNHPSRVKFVELNNAGFFYPFLDYLQCIQSIRDNKEITIKKQLLRAFIISLNSVQQLESIERPSCHWCSSSSANAFVGLNPRSTVFKLLSPCWITSVPIQFYSNFFPPENSSYQQQ